MSRRIRVPITVDNDVNAAAWAEWKFGGCALVQSSMIVNLGTGVAGHRHRPGARKRGRDGSPASSGTCRRCRTGSAASAATRAAGRTPVSRQRPRARGSGRHFAAKGYPWPKAAGGGGRRATWSAHHGGGPERRPDGDRAARRDRASGAGVGIANLAAAFDPGTFVIGGGVSAAGPLLLTRHGRPSGASSPGAATAPRPRSSPPSSATCPPDLSRRPRPPRSEAG